MHLIINQSHMLLFPLYFANRKYQTRKKCRMRLKKTKKKKKQNPKLVTDTMSFGLIDVGIIEIVLELVEKVGVGGLVVDGDDALAEDLQWVDVVNVHRFRGSLILHISEEFHLHRPHVFFFLVFLFPPSLSSDGIEGAGE